MQTLQLDATHRTDSDTAQFIVRRYVTRCVCCQEEGASHQRTARQAMRAASAAELSAGGAAHDARKSPAHRSTAPCMRRPP